MASFRNLLGLPVKKWDDRTSGQVLQLSSDKEHWEFGAGGGSGIHIDGRVATYADLPATPPTGYTTYLVDADGLIYIWDGSAFPADGDGLLLGTAMPLGINVAYLRKVIATFTSSVGAADPSVVTDGDTSLTHYLSDSGDGALRSIIVDLATYVSISSINVWHYYADGRIYNGTKTEVSIDGVNWTAVFDSATSGTYAESSSGHHITFDAQTVRFVRDWAQGSNSSDYNHWAEIEAVSG